MLLCRSSPHNPMEMYQRSEFKIIFLRPVNVPLNESALSKAKISPQSNSEMEMLPAVVDVTLRSLHLVPLQFLSQNRQHRIDEPAVQKYSIAFRVETSGGISSIRVRHWRNVFHSRKRPISCVVLSQDFCQSQQFVQCHHSLEIVFRCLISASDASFSRQHTTR